MGVAALGSGIEDVPVLKSELLERLRANKEKHEKEWAEAFSGYQKEWVKEALKTKAKAEKAHAKAMRNLQKAIDAAQRETEKESSRAKLPTSIPGVDCSKLPKAPRCFSADYEEAIDLFGMFQPSTDKDQPAGVIVLSVQDFMHYCRDKWSWRAEHRASVQNYLSSGPTGPVGSAGVAGPVGPDANSSLSVYDLDIEWSITDSDGGHSKDEAF